MRPHVLLQIAQRREELLTQITVERLAVVQPQVSAQPVARVERFVAARDRAVVRLDLRVHARVNLEAVRREKRFVAALLGALEAVLACGLFEKFVNARQETYVTMAPQS